ncbi:MAG: redox-sensing transcriptional repressor Rex [Thermodesulfobacteriota bacterium]
MARETKIPNATIERIALYVRPLERLLEEGTDVVSSRKLALLCRIRSAQVRKDLSYFGEFGVRGVGYDVRDLIREIKRILGTDRRWKLAIVGLGNMGKALAQDPGFASRCHRFVAAFDSDPEKIGTVVLPGVTIQPATKIVRVCQMEGVHIGVIAVPASQAQGVADRFLEAGVKAILNFSPFQVRKPECCHVENVDFTVSLDNLAYFLGRGFGR